MIILNKTTHKWNVENNKIHGMDNSTLAEYVKSIRHQKGLSLQAVADRSGDDIAPSHVSRIENGEITNPSPRKIKALAKGLGISQDELFNIIRGQRPIDSQEFKTHLLGSIFEKLSLASPRQRERAFVVLELLNESLDKDTEVSRR